MIPKRDDDCLLLAHYLAEAEDTAFSWIKQGESLCPDYELLIREYVFQSQRWPKAKVSSTVWEHRLIIYCPLKPSSEQALLFINGGTCHEIVGEENTPPQVLNLARIAAETDSVVIDLQDIPNQYLRFENQPPRQGDALLAYTWSKYLEDPDENSYWLLYFPMTKAVIKAMDLVQMLVSLEAGHSIKKFLLAGISKRGLTAWLAALSDERVNALVPIAIDILNTTRNMRHIYASYNNKWPPAFNDFINENIMAASTTKNFERLMSLEDPLCYIQNENKIYRERLSIPKYLISASGDDFFVPDSLNLYFDLLPGETKLRVLPNQSHFVDLKLVDEVLLTFYKSIVFKTPRPQLTWETTAAGTLAQVTTTCCPSEVKLWRAVNLNERDFRLAAGIQFEQNELKGYTQGKQFLYPVKLTAPVKGWEAHFVELRFPTEDGGFFTLTTPTYIVSC